MAEWRRPAPDGLGKWMLWSACGAFVVTYPVAYFVNPQLYRDATAEGVWILLVAFVAVPLATVGMVIGALVAHAVGKRSPRWRPDPSRQYQLRFWDGQTWTTHVIYPGGPGIDPMSDPRTSGDDTDA